MHTVAARGLRALLPWVVLCLVACPWGSRAGADVAYLYDDVGRLARIIRDDGAAATYHYDTVGNILRISRETGIPQTTSVSSISVGSAGRGARVTVTILGVNLSGAAVWTLLPGLIVENIRSTIDGLTFELVVGDDVPVGPTTLTVAGALGGATVPFTITAGGPAITSFSPTSGTVGTVVVVQGQRFDGRGPTFNTVTFNGVTAVVQAATETSITTAVPSGATGGPIRVITAACTAVSGTPFSVLSSGLTRVATIRSPFVGPIDVVVSPDRTRAAVLDGESVKVVDTATHTIVRTIPVTNRVDHGVMSPDGSRLYAISNLGPTTAIDLVNGVQLATISAGGAFMPTQVALTPDGRTLYVADRFGNAVRIVDTATNTVSRTLPITEPVVVAVSADGRHVYVMSARTETITVVDPATNTVATTIAGGGFLGVFSPDGSRFYHDTNTGDIAVVDTATNSLAGVITGLGEVLYLAIDPAGTRLYVTRWDPETFETSVAVVDLTTRAVVASIPVPAGFPDSMVLTPDGQRLVLVYDLFTVPRDAATVIDTTANAVVATIPLLGEEGLGSAAVGNRLVYVTMIDTGNVAVVDLAANATLDVPIARTGSPRAPIVFAPNGGPAYGPDGTTVIASFDPATAAARRNLSVPKDPEAFDFDPVLVAVDPVNGGTVYAANGSFLHFVSAASGAITATLAIADVSGLFPSPDGSRLAALTFFGDVIVIDTVSRTQVATLSLGIVSDVALRSPSGSRLYIADATAIHVVDLAGPSLVATIPTGINPRKLVLSADGRKLLALAPGDALLVVIDTTTNAVVGSVTLGGALRDMVASPTRPRAYVADETASRIRIIDTDTHAVVGTIPLPAAPTRLAFSPDGARLLAVLGAAGVVAAIDPQTDLLTTSLTLDHPVGEIAVAPSGRVFVQELEDFRVRRPLAVLE